MPGNLIVSLAAKVSLWGRIQIPRCSHGDEESRSACGRHRPGPPAHWLPLWIHSLWPIPRSGRAGNLRGRGSGCWLTFCERPRPKILATGSAPTASSTVATAQVWLRARTTDTGGGPTMGVWQSGSHQVGASLRGCLWRAPSPPHSDGDHPSRCSPGPRWQPPLPT